MTQESARRDVEAQLDAELEELLSDANERRDRLVESLAQRLSEAVMDEFEQRLHEVMVCAATQAAQAALAVVRRHAGEGDGVAQRPRDAAVALPAIDEDTRPESGVDR